MKCTFNKMLEIKNEEIRLLQSELAALKESPEYYIVQLVCGSDLVKMGEPFDDIKKAIAYAETIAIDYVSEVISEKTTVHWSSDL